MALSSPNRKLPFDILGLIFSHYVEYDTREYPLETLLLVCREWKGAALGHCALWNRLNIYLGHNPCIKLWRSRLPLRLQRCGPSTPLYITFCCYLNMSIWQYIKYDTGKSSIYSPLPCNSTKQLRYDSDACSCKAEMPAFIEQTIKMLVGPDGKLCTRWRYFEFDQGKPVDDHLNLALAKAMGHPTPMLETLVLKNVKMGTECAGLRLFPDAQSIESITIRECSLTSLPNFANVENATLGWAIYGVPQELNLRPSATRLKDLHTFMKSSARIILPPRLPALTKLHLTGDSIPTNLHECDMPSLSTLTVDIGMTDSIVSLTQCNPLRTKELRSITLIWGRGRVKYLRPPLLLESLPRLLSRFPEIDTIYMKGRVLDILLKALWVVPEESRPAVIGGKRLVNIDRDCFFDFVGTEDNASLELLAAEWELVPPNLPPLDWIKAL